MYVPSEAAGKTGLALTIVLPDCPRFPGGAPVVVHVEDG